MTEELYGEEPGPVVRPYLITGGRTPDERTWLDRATQIVSVQPRPATPRLELLPEHRTILDTCQRPVSIAELAATMRRPLGVVRVLCGDLLDHEAIVVRSPRAQVSRQILEQVYDGLCKL